MTDPYIDKILSADVYDVAKETPLTEAPSLSERLGCDVFLKREDLQPIFSFKCRGAYNKMASLSAEQRARGVVAASAGNHGQGVALAAQKLGVDATIVMPVTTPSIKVDAVRRRGANVGAPPNKTEYPVTALVINKPTPMMVNTITWIFRDFINQSGALFNAMLSPLLSLIDKLTSLQGHEGH